MVKVREALVHKIENTNMNDLRLYLQSINSIKHRVKTTFKDGVFIDIWSMHYSLSVL
jgi:hypothetical protein